jgi:D-alanyl-D-alanine carboxypeptidase (penicillin-binding protein 5/6)
VPVDTTATAVPGAPTSLLVGIPEAVSTSAGPSAVPETVPETMPEAVPEAGDPRPGRHRHARRTRRLPWVLGAVAILLVGAGVAVAVQRIERPLARPSVHPAPAVTLEASGPVPAQPWPPMGQGAVSIPSLGYASQSGAESPVPIASLTKLTTAVVVLRDHPLPAGAPGPSITVTSADVAEYDYELANDESNIPIQVGETLSEQQMLEALLTQSANDVAYILALWDAGTLPAFVQKMNALATSLGATHTHYVDASGYDPQSVSTASDVLRVAAAGMAIPAFAQVLGLATVTLPLVGTRPNIVTEVDMHAAIGGKSGFTSQAGASMMLAGERTIQGRQVLVLVAVLSQPTAPPPPPPTTPPKAGAAPSTTTLPSTTTTTTDPSTDPANDHDNPITDPFRLTRPVVDRLLAATEAGVVPVTVAAPGAPEGSVSSTWGGVAHPAPVVTAGGAWLLAWPGQRVRSLLHFDEVRPGSAAGARVGTALYGLGTQLAAVPLRLAAPLHEPTWWWRLLHTQ